MPMSGYEKERKERKGKEKKRKTENRYLPC
jgi:hypothetical protein